MYFQNLFALASLAWLTSAAPALDSRASKFQFLGVSESGAEFGQNAYPGTYGKDYTWPDPASIKTLFSQGFNTFRVPFAMERIAPNKLTGAFDSAYSANLTKTVNAITSLGAYAIIDPHNYGRYFGSVISSTSDFETFWKTLATLYKDNSRVIFDTNNEYHDEPGALVQQLNQAAINGIRGVGATSQYISVEGNAYTGAWTWTTDTGTDGKSNAQTMGSLTDPSNKLLYQMHQYLDSDGSGTSATCVSSTIGAERLVAATNWLRSNGKKGLVGEFAGGANSVCETAVKGMLQYIAQNSDVWTGALWWSAGPWWGTYMFSLEPTSGPAYSTYEPILKAYA